MRGLSRFTRAWLWAVTVSLLSVGPLASAPAATAAPVSSVAWHACEGKALAGFQCASFEVPLDWAVPAGPTITLQMARHRSSGTSAQRIGSLFFNPGGPGDSGLDIAPVLWKVLPQDVRQRFDLVTWDPRGIGASTAVAGCEFATYSLPPTGPVDWTAVETALRASTTAANMTCQAANPALAGLIGTNQVVQGLEAMRRAVGDARLTYWGASYGSRIGYTYALRYPDRVRALLLDGSVNPNSSITDFVSGYSTAADAGLGFFFQLYPKANRLYERSLAALETAPLTLADGTLFTRWDLKFLFVNFAGKEWSPAGTYEVLYDLLKTVDTAIRDAGAKGSAARKALLEIPHESTRYGMAGIPALVNCVDYADRPSAQVQQQVSENARTIAPIAGWYNGLSLIMECEGLDVTPDPVPTNFGTNTSIPMLLVGATRDANTPYVWTVDMARAFRASRVVTYVGSKHVSYAVAQSACVDGHVDDWLIHRRLPARDVACENVYRP